MSGHEVDVSHGCASGGGTAGVIPVHRSASSHCCAAVLAEGGTPETGFTCTGCGRPCSRVLGPPVAHWTCLCGERRRAQLGTGTDGHG